MIGDHKPSVARIRLDFFAWSRALLAPSERRYNFPIVSRRNPKPTLPRSRFLANVQFEDHPTVKLELCQ